MKDCIGKLLLSAILPGYSCSWSDSWGGDSTWNGKIALSKLLYWPLSITRSPIFVDKLLSVVYKSVVIFLVSPDFRSDIFGPTKIWLRDLQRLWAIFSTGKTLRTRGGKFRPGEFSGELLNTKGP
jgi:hypothetical protein